MGGNPPNWHDPENIPDDIQSTPFATDQLVRVLGNKVLGGLIEEPGDGFDLLWGLRQCLEHLPLFPLPPFGRRSSKEESCAMNDLGDPWQEWVLELLLVSEDTRDLAILLELKSTAGSPGSLVIVLIQLVETGQDLLHGLRSHEREPGVGAVLSELFGESAKEESTEHGAEPRILRRPHAIGVTPGSKVVGGKIGCEETISTNESDGIRKNSPRDGVARAETSARYDGLSFLGLEASVQLEVIDRAIEFLSGSSDLWVRIPFQEGRIRLQAKVLQKR